MRTARLFLGVATLVMIILAPPVALWQWRSAYLPDHVPTAGEAVAWLTSEDNGRLFLLLLVAAGLVAWLQLAAAIVVEVFARLRGTTVPRLPGFGWAQRIAAALLLVMLTGTAAEAAQAPSGDEGQPTHVVVPGDNLTKIAAGDLGNPLRYREVFDLNRGVLQPDGRSLQNPGLLRPGWVLQLPHDDHTDCEEIVVRPGQTLSQIAREELGDAGRYREIFDLSRGRLQPGGYQLDDPDTIRPGDVLRIPRLPKPAVGGGGAPAAAAFLRAPESCQPPEPQPPTPPAQPAKPPPSVRTPSTPGHPSSVATPSADTDDSASVVLAGIGGLLAAGLLTLLATRRRRAQQRRRPGYRIRNKPPGKFENVLHAAARPATVDELDQALRTLARNAGEQLPNLQAVKVGADGIRLQLVKGSKPLEPFVKAGTAEWRLDPSAGLDGGGESPPYPTLVSLGHTARRDLVLIDLREAGVLTLGGNGYAVEAVVLAMAWDLVAAPWAARTQITLVGAGKTSAERHPGRLRFAPGWDEAIDSLEPEGGRPHVVLSVIPLSEDIAQRLPPDGLDAVVAACGDVRMPSAWHLEIGDQRAAVDALGEEVELQRLTPTQVDELVAALAEADAPVQVPAEGYYNVPLDESGVPEPVQAVALPSLQVLGPVRLHGADPQAVEGKKLNRLTELAAFLALHPGVTADEISRQLGTDAQPWSAATRQGYISRLRTWLGRDEDGELYVPNVDARHGGYRMSASFTTDWQTFRDLARRGLGGRDAVFSDLQHALDLVKGTPFSNVSPGRYAWSSWLQREMTDAIVDVAHTLAEVHQKAGDLLAARRAAMRGLQAEPVSEILYRDLLRIEYRAGNLAAVRRTADKLTALAASLDVELDQETSALVSTLLAGRP
ncbi:BTAD domain-containing putative transcriptional regulator [Amycolatopsis sp. NPDC049691]|uniref:BTAD domain-containing putative transcriptional regulator n=1 Tax=Amycolatopsis sp. NPDC049691 TaxID=3155155 RepID=UPI00341A4E20